MSIIDQQGVARHNDGRFARTQNEEPEVTLVSLDSYQHVDNEDEVFRQVQQFVRLAKINGQDPSAAGAWLREFDPNETSELKAA